MKDDAAVVVVWDAAYLDHLLSSGQRKRDPFLSRIEDRAQEKEGQIKK